MTLVKLLILVVSLNLIRYFVIGLIEAPLTLDPLFATMEASPAYFNNDFTTTLWVTSYLFNFVMWSVVVFLYHLVNPNLIGNSYTKSLQLFGIMWIFFAAVSAVYMNHYSHPTAFYVWNILDGLLVFSLVSIANGFLYPRLFDQPRESE